jgi:hypothetical protein
MPPFSKRFAAFCNVKRNMLAFNDLHAAVSVAVKCAPFLLPAFAGYTQIRL